MSKRSHRILEEIASMEPTEKEVSAFELEKAKETLEANIAQAVQSHEAHIEGPVEIDWRTEGETLGENAEGLDATVCALVNSFQKLPVVQNSGIKVQKVTAIDSDHDGQVAVRVSYDYPR